MLSRDLSNNNPALLPSALTQHSAPVLSWVEECERKAGAFAAARGATFDGSIAMELIPGRVAGTGMAGDTFAIM